MGCRKSRTMHSITSTENTEMVRFETTWNVHKISFKELEAVCRRSSTAPLNKLLTAVNQSFALSLPPDLFENTSIAYEEFLIFFILAGKGSPKDKNQALWCVFDKNFEENLAKNDFRKMINSVVTASVEISLKYYAEKNQLTVIQSWYQQLKERIESLEAKLAKHFLEENDSISFEMFEKKCAEMPLGLISTVSALRTQLEHTQVIPKRFANPFKAMRVTKLTS